MNPFVYFVILHLQTVGASAGVGVALILLGIFVTNSKFSFQNFLDRVI